jgi:hypothetical protein
VFGLFKKKPPTMMDGFIRLMYGANPPAKSADLERSITIAHEDLLFERLSLSEVKRKAGDLFRGPIPYSTHDLAVSTALAFFKAPEYVPALQECQIPARLRVVNWAKDGKIVKPLAQSFEEVLYRLHKPQPSEAPPERPGETEQETAENITRLVHTYVALLQAHPHHIIDASRLPADKQMMIEIFKLSLLAPNEEIRKSAENWWCLLSRFQPGVGAVPIDFEISKDDPTVKEWRERRERVEKWVEMAAAEDEKYEREIERFKISHPT